jgi:hypothetical protein
MSFGVLLILAPGMGHKPSRLIAIIALMNFGVGAFGGLVATGPTHYGWMLLMINSVLIAIGMPSRIEAARSN